jgi:hypothetical protein
MEEGSGRVKIKTANIIAIETLSMLIFLDLDLRGGYRRALKNTKCAGHA